MLNVQEAIAIAKKAMPDGDLLFCVDYKDLYLFQILKSDPDERIWDPFYSVNKNTGEFRDFSILTDGDINEIGPLFIDKRRNLLR